MGMIAVTSVVHLGQIQSGLRNAITVAQGGHVSRGWGLLGINGGYSGDLCSAF